MLATSSRQRKLIAAVISAALVCFLNMNSFVPAQASAAPKLGAPCSPLQLNKVIKVGNELLRCEKLLNKANKKNSKDVWVRSKSKIPTTTPQPPVVTPPSPSTGNNNVGGVNPPTLAVADTGTITPAAVVFNQGAAHIIDLYEDMQCPYCGEFEAVDGADLDSLIASANYQVNFHLVAFLGPESILAGNATLCAAENGHFLAFHNFLFAHQQPVENFGAWDNSYFAQVANLLNITDPNFQSCLTTVKYQAWLSTQTQSPGFARTESTPSLYLDNQLLDNTAIAFNRNGFETLFGLNVV